MKTQISNKVRILGPNDLRRRRKRCTACIRRHIKCIGDLPCVNCQRMNIDCNLAQRTEVKSSIFINTTTTAQTIPVVSVFAPGDEVSRMIYFVFDFFESRQFVPVAVESYGNNLLELINRSAPLYYACVALFGAAENHSSDGSRTRKGMAANELCLRAYIKSMELLRRKLPNSGSGDQISTLENVALSWATFILSLVEIMQDPSASHWLSHHMFGTSELFRLSRPSPGQPFDAQRALFDIYRLVEACRSLLYNEPAMLLEEPWMGLQSQGDCSKFGCGQSYVFDRIVQLLLWSSSFANSMRSKLINMLHHSVVDADDYFRDLNEDGLRLQAQLLSWSHEVENSVVTSETTFTTLATLFRHAILIFLSGNYDYLPLLHGLEPTARRSPAEIQEHVLAIIHLTEYLLRHSHLARVLYLFPLRVAGARANCYLTASNVLHLVQKVSDGGFKAADRVASDLKSFWKDRDMDFAALVEGLNIY